MHPFRTKQPETEPWGVEEFEEEPFPPWFIMLRNHYHYQKLPKDVHTGDDYTLLALQKMSLTLSACLRELEQMAEAMDGDINNDGNPNPTWTPEDPNADDPDEPSSDMKPLPIFKSMTTEHRKQLKPFCVRYLKTFGTALGYPTLRYELDSLTEWLILPNEDNIELLSDKELLQLLDHVIFLSRTVFYMMYEGIESTIPLVTNAYRNSETNPATKPHIGTYCHWLEHARFMLQNREEDANLDKKALYEKVFKLGKIAFENQMKQNWYKRRGDLKARLDKITKIVNLGQSRQSSRSMLPLLLMQFKDGAGPIPELWKTFGDLPHEQYR